MTSERETIKILVVGILQGNNRGNWVAELLTRWDHKFCFDFRYSPLRVRPRQHLWSRIHQALLCVFAGLVDILQGLRAEIIYVPPKSYPYLKYGVALKRILEAKLLVDPYVFTLSTLEETGGEDCWMGNRAQCPEYDRLSPLKSDVILHPSATEVKLAAELSNVEAPLGKVVILPSCDGEAVARIAASCN